MLTCCMSNLHVEIWSDIACPWCYVGKRRFEAALARFAHRDDVTVTWRAFELDPQAPDELDHSLAEHLAQKYGRTLEQAEQMQAQMTEVAATDGLDFRFDVARGGSTFDAHRLVHLAAAHGLQDAMKERLLRAYFTAGVLVSDPRELERLGVEAGLPRDAVSETLVTGSYEEEVREDERTAASLGVQGVPFFVVDRRIAVSGAQPADVFLQLLDRAHELAAEAVPVI